MKDFVYSPECMFASYGFVYQKAFFAGTQHRLFVCPIERDKIVQTNSSFLNVIEGKKACGYLIDFLQRPETDADAISELFAKMMKENTVNGKNNIAHIDMTTALRMRINAKWYGTGIGVGYSTNFFANKYSMSNFPKPYRKPIAEFFSKFYPLNKLLKAEENFK